MRRTIFALAATLALVPGLASAWPLSVALDQSVRLTLGSTAQDVIIGNPDIADVSVADPRHLVITGKRYGVTNLIVVNSAGRTIFNNQLVVSTPERGRVSVYEGAIPLNYACSPRCSVDVNEAAQALSTIYGATHGAGSPSAPNSGVGGGSIQASPGLP